MSSASDTAILVAPLVTGDAAAPGFDVAAVEHTLAQLLSTPLHSGLGARERDPETVCHFLLRQAFYFRQQKSRTISFWQVGYKRMKAGCELGDIVPFWLGGGQFIISREFFPRLLQAVMVSNGIGGNTI